MIFAATMAIEFFIGSWQFDSAIISFITTSLGVVSVNVFIHLLKGMVSSIAKKTMYDVKIDEIADEINDYDSLKRSR